MRVSKRFSYHYRAVDAHNGQILSVGIITSNKTQAEVFEQLSDKMRGEFDGDAVVDSFVCLGVENK